MPPLLTPELPPVWEVVQLITRTLQQTGEALSKGGYPDLGSFVLEALKEGEKAKKAGGDEAEVALERVSVIWSCISGLV